MSRDETGVAASNEHSIRNCLRVNDLSEARPLQHAGSESRRRRTLRLCPKQGAHEATTRFISGEEATYEV